jgi:hypothetical protein
MILRRFSLICCQNIGDILMKINFKICPWAIGRKTTFVCNVGNSNLQHGNQKVLILNKTYSAPRTGKTFFDTIHGKMNYCEMLGAMSTIFSGIKFHCKKET